MGGGGGEEGKEGTTTEGFLPVVSRFLTFFFDFCSFFVCVCACLYKTEISINTASGLPICLLRN